MTYLPDEKVMVAGDILFTSDTPGPQVFKFEKGGSPTGWIENAEGILATDADVYVTGHGDDTMTKDQVRKKAR
jgi:glyoxylase-like metal-dependent hydrolase (beta-lactamase superfamily II)